MSDDRESTEPVARSRKPYQFTVRTFFAAAVWLGLMMAAVTTLKHEGALGTAVLGLAWIAFAELYRRFRATRALVALGTGPVVLLALWNILFVTTDARARGALPPVSWFLMFAFGWGIVLSVVVIIERGVERWMIRPVCRSRNPRASEVGDGPLPAPSSNRLGSAAVSLAVHTAIALFALGFWWGTSRSGTWAGSLLVFVADLPVMSVYASIPAIDPPHVMPNLALASLVLGGALYAATGWLVAHLAARFERRGRAVGRPDGSSGDAAGTPDGREV